MSIDHAVGTTTSSSDRILIVEDEPAVAEAIAELLAHCGREVTVCHDVEAAELMVDHLQPDRVISDVRLTGPFRFEGLEFLDHLAELPHRCQTVLISGAVTPELEAEAERRGAVAVLQKPFDVADLERLIGPPRAHRDGCTGDGKVIHVPFLDDIIFSDRLIPDFQPIVRIEGAGMFGFESLARYETDSLLGEPAILFAYAAQKGRVVELERACMARSFELAGPLMPFGFMFLNIHPTVLNEGDRFSEFLREEAQRWDIPLDRVVLELTEQAQVRIDPQFFAAVEDIRSCGVRFAFDDVGVAYSHLPLIDRVRPSFLKVSQDFGTGFEVDTTRSKLVRNLLALSNEFGVPLILEGIESAATVEAARELGIALGQGFHYAYPARAEHLLEWAKEHPDTAPFEQEVFVPSIGEDRADHAEGAESPAGLWGDATSSDSAVVPAVAAGFAVPQEHEQSGDVSDHFLHAIKQIVHLGEAETIEPQAVDRFVENILPAALEMFPPESRGELRARIAELKPREKFFVTAGDVPLPGAPSTSSPLPSSDVRPTRSRVEKRFALMLGLLSKRAIPSFPNQVSEHDTTLAQLLVLAVEIAATEHELNDNIGQIPQLGSKGIETMFHVLSHGMASWDLALDTGGESTEVLRAMKRVFSLSTDPEVRAKRFRELTLAAVERLIDGAFSAAASMLELGETVVDELPLPATVIESIRSDAGKLVRAGGVDRFAKDTQRHAVLRRALRFFSVMSPEVLLDQLRDQTTPEGRDEIRAILKIWGPQARQTALERIDRQLDSDAGSAHMYLHDLLALLKSIPRDPDRDIRHELTVLSRASAPGRPLTVVIGALTAIGEIRREAAVRLLKQRLSEFAAIPSRGDGDFYESAELSKILDANVAALARSEAPAGLRAIAQHGLRQEGGLGDTRSRLVHLAKVDLLLDLETVSMLVKAIRADLPEKNMATPKAKDLTPLIEALRGTGGETVRLLLHHVAADYPGQPFGAAAANILKERAGGTKQPGAGEKTEGELPIYAIPRLIQSFVASAATGTLALADEGREVQGRLVFQEGRLIDVTASKLRNAEALYQLIERPVVGSFAFTPRPLPITSSARTPADVHALLLEGMRRWDELQMMLALAPDDVSFRPTGSRPTRHPQENDPQFLREIWVRASSGQPLGAWENEIRADSWRIRRIVARWVEDESLRF